MYEYYAMLAPMMSSLKHVKSTDTAMKVYSILTDEIGAPDPD